jgi:hypothetical protein
VDYFWRPRVVALRYLEVLCWCRTWYCTCHVPFVQDRDTIIPSVLHEFLLYVGGRRPFPAQCSQRRRGRTVAARSAACITSHYGCCQPSSQVPLARSPEATGRWIVRLEQLFLRAMPCCGQAPPHRPPSQPMANGRGPSSRAHPGNPLSLPAAASIRLLPYGAMYAAKVATQPGVPALPESDTRSLCS